jgi:hypothetical protein
MRGKLRDKRATYKKDGVNHEGLERRQPYKRGSVAINWHNQDIEEEEYDVEMDEGNTEDEASEIEQIKLPNKK